MTNGIGYLAALILAGVFAFSAVAKLRDPSASRRALRAARVPGSAVIALAVPVVELSVAAALLVRPDVGAVAAIVVLAVFTGFIAYLLVKRIDVSCGCFGANATESVSSVDIVRNTFLLFAAFVALQAGAPVAVALEEVVLASTTLAIVVVVLAAMTTRNKLGQLFDNRLPGER